MQDVRALNEIVAKESAFIDDLLAEIGKVIVGQSYMIERVLVGLLAGGHVLLLKSNRELMSWGNNFVDNLGRSWSGSDDPTPAPTNSFARFVVNSVFWAHAAIKNRF